MLGTEIEILAQILYYVKYIFLLSGTVFVFMIIKQVYNFFAHFIFGRNLTKDRGKGGTYI